MTYRLFGIWDMADLQWLLNSCIAPDRFCQRLNSFRSMDSAKPDFSLACWIKSTPKTNSPLAGAHAWESTCALSINQETKLKPGKQVSWSLAARISCVAIGKTRTRQRVHSGTASFAPAMSAIRTQTDTSTFSIV